MTEIHIDFRETDLLNELQISNTLPISSKNLDVGDAQIVHDGNPIFVFERKTVADLGASVKDGRYKEQKCRLLAAFPKHHHITYIIEGGSIFIGDKSGLSSSTYEGIFINTMYRDGIHVVCTKSVQETARWISGVAKRYNDDPQKYTMEGGNVSEEYYNQRKAKTRRIDNITPRTCFIMQLCQIPGISQKIAEIVAARYASLPILITELSKSDNPEQELAKLSLIGSKKAKVIIQYTFLETT